MITLIIRKHQIYVRLEGIYNAPTDSKKKKNTGPFHLAEDQINRIRRSQQDIGQPNIDLKSVVVATQDCFKNKFCPYSRQKCSKAKNYRRTGEHKNVSRRATDALLSSCPTVYFWNHSVCHLSRILFGQTLLFTLTCVDLLPVPPPPPRPHTVSIID